MWHKCITGNNSGGGNISSVFHLFGITPNGAISANMQAMTSIIEYTLCGDKIVGNGDSTVTINKNGKLNIAITQYKYNYSPGCKFLILKNGQEVANGTDAGELEIDVNAGDVLLFKSQGSSNIGVGTSVTMAI